METALLLTFILFCLELIEAYLQRAPTLMLVIERLHTYYQKSIFLFFATHLGLYFVLFVVLATDILNASMILLLLLKVIDLFSKLELIKRVFKRQNVSEELMQMLEKKMPSWYFLLGAGIYPPLLFYALT